MLLAAESSCTEPQASGIAAGASAPAVTGGIAEGIPVVPGPLMPHLHPMAVPQPHLQVMQQAAGHQGAAAGSVPGAPAAAPAGWPCIPPQGVPGWGPLTYAAGPMQPGVLGMPGSMQPAYAAVPVRPPVAAGDAAGAVQQEVAAQQYPPEPGQQQQHVAQGTALQPYDHLHMAGVQMAPMIHFNWHQCYQMQQQQYMQMFQQQQDGSKSGGSTHAGPSSQVAAGMPALAVPGQPVAGPSPAAAATAGLPPQGPSSQGAGLPGAAGGFMPGAPLHPMMPGYSPMGMVDPSFQAYQQQQWHQWHQQMMMQQQMYMQQQHMYYQQQLHLQQQQHSHIQQPANGDMQQQQQQQDPASKAASAAVPAADSNTTSNATCTVAIANGQVAEAVAMAISPVKDGDRSANATPAAVVDGLACVRSGLHQQPAALQGAAASNAAMAGTQGKQLQQQQPGVPAGSMAAPGGSNSWPPPLAAPGPMPAVTSLPGMSHAYGHMCIPQPPVVIVVCNDNKQQQQQQQQGPTTQQDGGGAVVTGVPAPVAAAPAAGGHT